MFSLILGIIVTVLAVISKGWLNSKSSRDFRIKALMNYDIRFDDFKTYTNVAIAIGVILIVLGIILVIVKYNKKKKGVVNNDKSK